MRLPPRGAGLEYKIIITEICNLWSVYKSVFSSDCSVSKPGPLLRKLVKSEKAEFTPPAGGLSTFLTSLHGRQAGITQTEDIMDKQNSIHNSIAIYVSNSGKYVLANVLQVALSLH